MSLLSTYKTQIITPFLNSSITANHYKVIEFLFYAKKITNHTLCLAFIQIRKGIHSKHRSSIPVICIPITFNNKNLSFNTHARQKL